MGNIESNKTENIYVIRGSEKRMKENEEIRKWPLEREAN